MLKAKLPPASVDVAKAVEARCLTKEFGSGASAVTAVNEVDLDVNRGEIVLIMGPSGSGKTTLLTLLGAMLRPTRGSVKLFGQEVTALSESLLPSFRRRFLGFVFQSFNLLEALTAQQNVEVALNLAGVKGAPAREKARALLTQFGMEQRSDFRPRQLSGGERQRVSIARALANDAPLILADEPTANLDSGHGREVVSLLHDLSKQQGKTVVIVSHDGRLADAADRVLWMEDGALKERD